MDAYKNFSGNGRVWFVFNYLPNMFVAILTLLADYLVEYLIIYCLIWNFLFLLVITEAKFSIDYIFLYIRRRLSFFHA